MIGKKIDPVSTNEPTVTKGIESSKSSIEMNINDVPAIIKQWMSIN
jgi:hypothetical protein